MAVEVTIQKPGATSVQTVNHEAGKSYGIKDGILHVFNDPNHQRTNDQIAVYAPGQWLSAVVSNS